MVMAQFPSLDPYRWPGWFIATLSLVLGGIVLIFFTESRPWTCGKFVNGCSMTKVITKFRKASGMLWLVSLTKITIYEHYRMHATSIAAL